jgi:hypothetical protein
VSAGVEPSASVEKDSNARDRKRGAYEECGHRQVVRQHRYGLSHRDKAAADQPRAHSLNQGWIG